MHFLVLMDCHKHSVCNFKVLLNLDLGPLLQKRNRKNQVFLTLSSKIIAKSPEFTFFKHILFIFARKNLHILRIAKTYVFLRFSRNNEKWIYAPCCCDPFNY